MVLTCFFSTTTAINNYDWRNEGHFYERIIKLSPLCANAYVNLGVYYRDKGLLDDAEKQFKKAISLDKNDYVKRVYLAEVYLLKNRLDDSISEFETILKDFPGGRVASIYNVTGYMYQMKKSYAVAIDYYKKALGINPDFVLVRCNLASAYFNLGKTQECFTELEKAIGIEGLLTFRAKDGPTEKEIKEVIKQNKEYGGIFNELAMLFSKYGRFEIAEKIFLRAAELYPNNVETRFNLGALYYNLGRFDQARAQWRATLKINPGHLPSLEWLRILQNKQNN
jgi:tetratricopeptide (TPR) repeat protein